MILGRLINEPYNQQKVYERILSRHILNFGWAGKSPSVVYLGACFKHHLRNMRFNVCDHLMDNLKDHDSYAMNMCVIYLEEIELYYKILEPSMSQDEYIQNLSKIRQTAREGDFVSLANLSRSSVIKEFVANPDCYKLLMEMEKFYLFLEYRAIKSDLYEGFSNLMDCIRNKKWWKATKLFFYCLKLSLSLRLKRFLKQDDKHLSVEVE